MTGISSMCGEINIYDFLCHTYHMRAIHWSPIWKIVVWFFYLSIVNDVTKIRVQFYFHYNYVELTDLPQGELLPKKDLSNLQDQELFQVFSFLRLQWIQSWLNFMRKNMQNFFFLINFSFAAAGGSLSLQETQRQAGEERDVPGKWKNSKLKKVKEFQVKKSERILAIFTLTNFILWRTQNSGPKKVKGISQFQLWTISFSGQSHNLDWSNKKVWGNVSFCNLSELCVILATCWKVTLIDIWH